MTTYASTNGLKGKKNVTQKTTISHLTRRPILTIRGTVRRGTPQRVRWDHRANEVKFEREKKKVNFLNCANTTTDEGTKNTKVLNKRLEEKKGEEEVGRNHKQTFSEFPFFCYINNHPASAGSVLTDSLIFFFF